MLTRRPLKEARDLIECFDFLRELALALIIEIFSCGISIVILREFQIKPKWGMDWEGIKFDFFSLMKKPKLVNNLVVRTRSESAFS